MKLDLEEVKDKAGDYDMGEETFHDVTHTLQKKKRNTSKPKYV